jgi:hypothetical protein
MLTPYMEVLRIVMHLERSKIHGLKNRIVHREVNFQLAGVCNTPDA